MTKRLHYSGHRRRLHVTTYAFKFANCKIGVNAKIHQNVRSEMIPQNGFQTHNK